MNSPAFLFLRRLFRRKLVLVAAILLAAVVLVALLAPWVSPYDPGAMRVVRRLRPPGADNLLGTDELGRDVLSRVIFGARASYGVDSTTVVRVVTLALVRISCSSRSRSLGPPTRTSSR